MSFHLLLETSSTIFFIDGRYQSQYRDSFLYGHLELCWLHSFLSDNILIIHCEYALV
jgi:hypothetical protein